MRDIRASINQTVRAVLNSAADTGGRLPHDLGVVVLKFRIGHIWVVVAVRGWVSVTSITVFEKFLQLVQLKMLSVSP
jgi:hypothetical protein